MNAPRMTPLLYDQLKSLTSLLKKRFPNLTAEETLTLAADIMMTLAKVQEQRHE